MKKLIRVKNPCFNCKQRTVTCHHDCKAYAEYDQYRQDLRAAKLEESSKLYGHKKKKFDTTW